MQSFFWVLTYVAIFMLLACVIHLNREITFEKKINCIKDQLSLVLGEYMDSKKYIEKLIESLIVHLDGAQGASLILKDENGNFEYVVQAIYDEETEEIVISEENMLIDKELIESDIEQCIECNYNKKIIKLSNLNITKVINGVMYITRDVLVIPIKKEKESIAILTINSIEGRRELTKNDIKIMESLEDCIASLVMYSVMRENILNLSFIDEVTGIRNRRSLKKRFLELKNGDMDNFEQTQLVMIDIDSFKHINDTRGHKYGDKALRDLASSLEGFIGACGEVFRVSGDEFVVLMRGMEREKVYDFFSNIDKQFKEDNSNLIKGISFGITSLREHYNSELKDIMDLADKEMYIMKKWKKAQEQ